MATRKLNMPELPLRSEPEPKAKPTKAAKDTVQFQMRIALPKRELHATKVVTMKIPIQLYADIDEIRSETGLTATEIFVRTATPEVAELLRQLRERKAQEAGQ